MVSPSALAARFAAEHDDPEGVSTEKATIFLVAAACCIAGLVWSGMYWAVFGWGLTAALPLSFTVIVGASMVTSHVRRDHRPVVTVQLAAIILITSFIQWSIGGLVDSGFVFVWALLGPIGALQQMGLPSQFATHRVGFDRSAAA